MAEAGRFWVQLAPLSRPETPRPELSPLICRPAPVGMKRVSFPVAAADEEDVANVAAGFAVNAAAAAASTGVALLSRPESPRPELSPLVSCAGPAERRPAPVRMKRVSFPVAAADKEDVDNVAAGFAVNVNLVKSILLIPRERFLETPPSSAAAVPREECCRH